MNKIKFSKLSTQKMQKKVEKPWTFESFPTYPHKNICFWWKTWIKKANRRFGKNT